MRLFIKNNQFNNKLIIVQLDTEDIPEGYDEVFDFTSFDMYKDLITGNFFGIRDWFCLRSEIKRRVETKIKSDYSMFELLSSHEKEIVLSYLPTKVISNLGYQFFIDNCGSFDNANQKINNYLINSEQSRSLRYEVFVKYAYGILGLLDGLKAERFVRFEQLNTQFICRGICHFSEDGISGLVDWLIGSQDSSYSENNLKHDIEIGTYTIKDETTIEDFINNCILILEEGIY